MFWLFALPLLTSCVQLTTGADGGVKIQMTQKGLEYGKDLGLEVLKSMMKKEPIQDVQGSHKIPLIGRVDYSISGTRIVQVQVSHSTAVFTAGTGLHLDIQNAEISLASKWKLSHPFGRGHGDLDVTVRQLSLSTQLGLGKGHEGQLSVWDAGCKSSIGGIKLKLHGKSSWFYNSIVSTFKKTLKSEINKQLCSEIKEGIDRLAQILKDANVMAQIDSFAGFDYSLVSKPQIGVDQCTVELKGEFYPLGKSSREPLRPAPFSLPKKSDSMIVFGISQFVANSAAFTYFTAGAFRVNYTDDMIPKDFLFRLNTRNISLFSPGLNEHFPDMPMVIQLAARKQPLLSMKPDGVDATISGCVEAFVVLPNASLVPVFLLNFDGNLMGQIFFEPVKSGNSIGKAGGSVTLKSFHLSQQWSKVGDIKVTALESTLKVAGPLMLSRLNKHLKKGILLPHVPNTSLQNPKVTKNEGYLVVATNLHYQPQ